MPATPAASTLQTSWRPWENLLFNEGGTGTQIARRIRRASKLHNLLRNTRRHGQRQAQRDRRKDASTPNRRQWTNCTTNMRLRGDKDETERKQGMNAGASRKLWAEDTITAQLDAGARETNSDTQNPPEIVLLLLRPLSPLLIWTRLTPVNRLEISLSVILWSKSVTSSSRTPLSSTAEERATQTQASQGTSAGSSVPRTEKALREANLNEKPPGIQRSVRTERNKDTRKESDTCKEKATDGEAQPQGTSKQINWYTLTAPRTGSHQDTDFHSSETDEHTRGGGEEWLCRRGPAGTPRAQMAKWTRM